MTMHRFGVDPSEIMTSRETQEFVPCLVTGVFYCNVPPPPPPPLKQSVHDFGSEEMANY